MAEKKSAKEQKSNKGLIACIVGAVVLVIAIILCVILGNSTPKVVGKYKLYAYISNGEESTTMVSLMEGFGVSVTTEFNKDKTGTLNISGSDENEVIKFKYDDKKIYFEDSEETGAEDSEYTYKDDYVTFKFGDEEMKFKRSE